MWSSRVPSACAAQYPLEPCEVYIWLQTVSDTSGPAIHFPVAVRRGTDAYGRGFAHTITPTIQVYTQFGSTVAVNPRERDRSVRSELCLAYSVD